MTEIEKLLKEKENIDKNIKNRERRKKEIDKLIEELKNKKWKPSLDEKYYFIDYNRTICCLQYHCDDTDKDCLSIGNYFRTKEEAEFEAERLKVLEELKEFSYEFSDDEWNNNSINTINKYYLYYDYESNNIRIGRNNWCKESDIYFKTKRDAKKAIEKIGEDRLKKYYFKVGR